MKFNLAKYREQKKMSQEDLAKAIGCSRITISNWELEKSYPNVEQLYNICLTLNCSPNELLGIKVTPQMKETSRLIKAYMECPDDRREDIVRQASALARLSQIERE